MGVAGWGHVQQNNPVCDKPVDVPHLQQRTRRRKDRRHIHAVFLSKPHVGVGIHTWGVFRICSRPCLVEKPYVYNESFTVVYGHRFFQNGHLNFNSLNTDLYLHGSKLAPSRDGIYRTAFGYGVVHNGVIYCKCIPCLNLASRRLTELRSDSLARDNELFENQSRFIRAQLRPFLLEYTDRRTELAQPLAATNDAEWYHARVHAKRAIRIAAWKSLCELRGFGHTWRATAEALFKCDEYAKLGKYPRQVINLQVENALQGGYVTEYIKSVLSTPMVDNDGHFEFVKCPSYSDLSRVFSLAEDPKPFVFVYYSDDSLCAVNYGGVIRRFNVDISSCDRSHGPELFATIHHLFPEHKPLLLSLIAQCRLPIRYSDPVTGQRCAIKPKTPRLYSGSVLTTIMANLASLTIGLALRSLLSLSPNAPVGAIVKGIEDACGYTITLQECVRVEDLQFLKHSPARDVAGTYQPILNPGVLLRLTGTCKGDLPGRGDLRMRAISFQYTLLRGIYSTCSFPWFDSLLEGMRVQLPTIRPAMPPCTCIVPNDDSEIVLSCPFHGDSQWRHIRRDTGLHVFRDVDVFARYNLTDVEHAQLPLLHQTSFGQQVSCSAYDRILALDYGLESGELRFEPFH